MAIQVTSNNPEADSAVNAAPAADAPISDTEVAQSTSGGNAATEKPVALETTETEEQEETEIETETEAETQGKDASGQATGKKKGGFQRKLEKERAEKEAVKQRVAFLEGQLAAQTAGAKPNAETKPVAMSTEAEPNPNDFENHADWVKATIKWEHKQTRAEERAAAEREKFESENQNRVKAYGERLKAFSETVEDFDDAMKGLAADSPAIRDAVFDSENGPELIYELAKNPSEAKRIASLSYSQASRELGKLEARLSKPSSETKEQKTTKAPTPIAPVGGGGKGSITKSITDPNLSQAEYEKLRREQMKRKA